MSGASVAVLAPVYGRPQNALPLADSLFASESGLPLYLHFLFSPDDPDERDACQAVEAEYRGSVVAHGMPWRAGIRGDFSRKTNYGLWLTDNPFVLCGADDLEFEAGWADEAVRVAEATGAGFVATNDQANPKVIAGQHATHPLVRRSYAYECGTIDTPGLIYHEGYHHLFVDNEATETAQSRDCFAFAEQAVVRHLHPIWGTAPTDATYEHGNSRQLEDAELFNQRRPLWT